LCSKERNVKIRRQRIQKKESAAGRTSSVSLFLFLKKSPQKHGKKIEHDKPGKREIRTELVFLPGTTERRWGREKINKHRK